MVTVKYILVFTPFFIQGVVSRAEEATAEKAALPEAPKGGGYPDYVEGYVYKEQPYYGEYPAYGGYVSPSTEYAAYSDYVHPSTDYTPYGDYVETSTGYAAYVDYVHPSTDYTPYGGYDKTSTGYAAYVDYVHPSSDDGTYDYVWGEYIDDYPFMDYYGAVDDRFAYGDRNNPADTLQHVQDQTAVLSQIPWVYIVIPVIEIDVFYLNDDHTAIEDIQMQLPVETYLFELGDFGMGHLELGDWGLDDWYTDYGLMMDYQYDYMVDYADYGHYPPPADLYKTGDQLDDETTLDYPGIDHDPFWVDWIFMVPPDEMIPVVR